ncbi:MAG: hypothetical protein ABFS21_07730 [Actinomycetota bacterium]
MKRTRTGVVVMVLMAVMLVAGVAFAAGGTEMTVTDTQSVQWFADGTDTGGYSYLTRTSDELLLSAEAQDLIPGNAYTVWWVVFNNPEACSAPGCSEDDIFGEDGNLNVEGVIAAGIAVGNATANVAKANGTAEFGARLKKGDTMSDHQILFPSGLAGGALLTAMPGDAEIHLIFQDHGQARGGPELLNQLTYVETGCTPFCDDVQFSVFPALP